MIESIVAGILIAYLLIKFSKWAVMILLLGGVGYLLLLISVM